jgi:hypothetical protein
MQHDDDGITWNSTIREWKPDPYTQNTMEYYSEAGQVLHWNSLLLIRFPFS